MNSLPIHLAAALFDTADDAVLVDPPGISLGNMIAGSGICGWVVVLMAIVGVILALLRIMELRMGGLAPADLQRSLEMEIHGGDVARAAAMAGGNPSFLGRVAAGGLRMHELGLDEMLANIERVSTKESMRIGNRVANLSRFGGATLLVGFLGSALGMLLMLRVMSTLGAPIGPYEYESFSLALFPLTMALLVALFSFGTFFVLDHRLTVRTLRVREIAEEMAYLVDAGHKRPSADRVSTP